MTSSLRQTVLRSTAPLAAGLFTAAAAAAGLAVTAAEPASAARTCSGSLKSTTVQGDLHVPAGASCTAYGVTVRGDVKIARGGTLRFSSGQVDGNVQGTSAPHTVSVYNARVRGDVQATSARYVKVQGSTVDGNVQTERTRDGQHVVTSRVGGDVQSTQTNTRVDKNRIDGDVQHKDGRHLSLRSNVIGGNAQIEDNRYWQRVYGNTIRENLDCSGNSPAPVGSGNRVGGSKTGQCRGL